MQQTRDVDSLMCISKTFSILCHSSVALGQFVSVERLIKLGFNACLAIMRILCSTLSCDFYT